MEEQRKCKICGKEDNIDNFANAGIFNGKQYYRHICKQCYYKSKVSRRLSIREWFLDYKKTLKCEKCGNSDYRVLDFHHLKDKTFLISEASLRGFSIETLEKEINKCIILCANCHRIEHFNENVV